jgi:hypothetical protein
VERGAVTDSDRAALDARIYERLDAVAEINERLEQRRADRREAGLDLAELWEERDRQALDREQRQEQQPAPPEARWIEGLIDARVGRATRKWLCEQLVKFAEGIGRVVAEVDNRDRIAASKRIEALERRIEADGAAVVELIRDQEQQIASLTRRLAELERSVPAPRPRLIA